MAVRLVTNQIAVSYTDSSARNSTALEANRKYALYATTDCHVLQGGSSVAATTSAPFLRKETYVDIYAVAGDLYIAAIRSSASGSLYIIPL